MSELAIFGGPQTVQEPMPQWPTVFPEDVAAVEEALRKSAEDKSNLTSAAGGGPVAQFEKSLQVAFDARHAVATSSGWASLHTALMAVGIEAGDEVIVPPYTWGQSVSCILHQLAIPVFADIDRDTYTLDASSVEARITRFTRAIMVVHLYGQPADMAPILAVARRHGLAVIEDCAQAAGARYRGEAVGTLGDVGCFSIGDGKQMIGGEGGFLLTNSAALYERALLVGQHPARQQRELKDEFLRRQGDSLIFTYRIHPLAAVLCNSQLGHLDEWNADRRRNFARLSQGLAEVDAVRPVVVPEWAEHAYHMYSPSFVAEAAPGVTREAFVQAVRAEGVPLSSGYVKRPIHLWPRIQQQRYVYGRNLPWSLAHRPVEYRAGDCPVAERRCAEEELGMGGAAWIGDCSAAMDQVVEAFQKVGSALERLRTRAGAMSRI